MTLFRYAIPRRALAGAFLGFLYSVLVLLRGDLLTASGWLLLAIGLLFAKPIAYYGYVTWAILWMAWRGVLVFRQQVPMVWGVVDVLVPLLSVALVSSSGYLDVTKGAAFIQQDRR